MPALSALRRIVRRWLRRWFPGRFYRPLYGRGWKFSGVMRMPITTPLGFVVVPYRLLLAPTSRTASIQTARLDHYTRLYSPNRN